MKNLDNNCIKTDGRNLYKIALFLCSLFLITTNCENDNEIFLEENKGNTSKEPVTVEQVFVEDIPHISNSIASMTYQYRGLNNEKENVNYTIDTERIIKAIDSIGNITYAFEIITTDTPDNVLYNLIVTQKTDGKEIPPFIIKYEFENATKYDYGTPTEDLKFQAKASIYSYENFFQTEPFQNRATAQSRSSGTDPCIEIDNSTTSGSGGGGNGNPTGGNYTEQTSSIGGKGGYGIYVIPISGGGGGKTGKVICGELIMHATVHSANRNSIPESRARAATSTGSCPEGEVLLPINKTPDRIINELTNPCASLIFEALRTEMLSKDILQKMMQPTAKVNLNFAESILKLFNDSNTFHLSIANDYLKDANGSTTGASITISDSYLKNATNLSIARTMIHEMVHAYLNVKYGNALSFDNGMDFRLKMEKFAKDNGITDINTDKFHHEFMGQYIDAMAASLLIWDEKYGTGGIKTKDSTGKEVLDWEYYRTMAFGGLSYAKRDSEGNFILDNDKNLIYVDTDSFKALVPKEADRDKIKTTIINEQKGKKNAKGKRCK